MRWLLTALVCVALALGMALDARAEGSVPGSNGSAFYMGGAGPYSDPVAGCAEYAKTVDVNLGYGGDNGVATIYVTPPVPSAQPVGTCDVQRLNRNDGSWYHSFYADIYDYAGTTCPPNASASGSSCVCASGYVPSGGGCAPAASACTGVASGMSGTYYASSGGGGTNLCSGNCVISSGVSGTDSSGTYFGAPFTATGQACSGGSSQPASTSGLIPGNCPGTINGVAVPGGVPCTSTTSNTTKTTTPGPTSSSSAPAGTPDGTTSSSSSTTCTGGNCTTTTTTSGTSGGNTTTGSSTTTQSQSSYCQANPNDPQCTNQSSFGGSCAADFSCKGDAVQCAQAKIEYESACYFSAAPSTSTASKYTSLSSQAGQPVTGAFTDSQSIANALPAAPGAAVGLADTSVTIGTGVTAMTLSVPLGQYVNPFLSVIRGVITAFGYLFFVMIVFVRK